MTLVGVISDTHGRLHAQAYVALADCDHIIHAGDVGDPDVLRELETLAPVTAVLGNNDWAEYGPDVQRSARLTIDEVKFLVAHFPQDVRLRGLPGQSVLGPGDPIPDVCIHGHTHLPRLVYGKDARPASFVLCPGSASYPRGGSERSIAKVSIESGAVKGIRIETLGGTEIMGVGTL